MPNDSSYGNKKNILNPGYEVRERGSLFGQNIDILATGFRISVGSIHACARYIHLYLLMGRPLNGRVRNDRV